MTTITITPIARLGLAIVERAVRTLGGQIELQSTPGQGSEFRVILPADGTLAQPVAAGVTPPTPAPPALGSRVQTV